LIVYRWLSSVFRFGIMQLLTPKDLDCAQRIGAYRDKENNKTSQHLDERLPST
jgi:hypothetical protein